MAECYIVKSSDLIEYGKEIFMNKDVAENDAYIVAESLVDADLRRVTSHGVTRIGNYLDRLGQGGIDPKPKITVVSETKTTAVIDGGNCFGAVVSEMAVQMAREKAKSCGLAYIVVRYSNHYGAAAHWAIKTAGNDMIGFTGSNVEPYMCVTGGCSKGIGNNPLSYAFPTANHGVVCYDVACSIMAGGKMFEYRREGKTLPENCFLDNEGIPTTDPNAAALMVPFGGHKGYGLAVVVEMLSSVLSGGNFGREMGSQYEKLNTPNHIAHYFIALDIEAFRPLAEYKASADKFVDYLHSLPRRKGVERILVPGELENESKAERVRNGIPLSLTQIEELERYGLQAGLPPQRLNFLRKQPA